MRRIITILLTSCLLANDLPATSLGGQAPDLCRLARARGLSAVEQNLAPTVRVDIFQQEALMLALQAPLHPMTQRIKSSLLQLWRMARGQEPAPPPPIWSSSGADGVAPALGSMAAFRMGQLGPLVIGLATWLATGLGMIATVALGGSAPEPAVTLAEADKRTLLELYRRSEALGVELFAWGEIDAAGQLQGSIGVPAADEMAIVTAQPRDQANDLERLLVGDADFRRPILAIRNALEQARQADWSRETIDALFGTIARMVWACRAIVQQLGISAQDYEIRLGDRWVLRWSDMESALQAAAPSLWTNLVETEKQVQSGNFPSEIEEAYRKHVAGALSVLQSAPDLSSRRESLAGAANPIRFFTSPRFHLTPDTAHLGFDIHPHSDLLPPSLEDVTAWFSAPAPGYRGILVPREGRLEALIFWVMPGDTYLQEALLMPQQHYPMIPGLHDAPWVEWLKQFALKTVDGELPIVAVGNEMTRGPVALYRNPTSDGGALDGAAKKHPIGVFNSHWMAGELSFLTLLVSPPHESSLLSTLALAGLLYLGYRFALILFTMAHEAGHLWKDGQFKGKSFWECLVLSYRSLHVRDFATAFLKGTDITDAWVKSEESAGPGAAATALAGPMVHILAGLAGFLLSSYIGNQQHPALFWIGVLTFGANLALFVTNSALGEDWQNWRRHHVDAGVHGMAKRSEQDNQTTFNQLTSELEALLRDRDQIFQGLLRKLPAGGEDTWHDRGTRLIYFQVNLAMWVQNHMAMRSLRALRPIPARPQDNTLLSFMVLEMYLPKMILRLEKAGLVLDQVPASREELAGHGMDDEALERQMKNLFDAELFDSGIVSLLALVIDCPAGQRRENWKRLEALLLLLQEGPGSSGMRFVERLSTGYSFVWSNVTRDEKGLADQVRKLIAFSLSLGLDEPNEVCLNLAHELGRHFRHIRATLAKLGPEMARYFEFVYNAIDFSLAVLILTPLWRTYGRLKGGRPLKPGAREKLLAALADAYTAMPKNLLDEERLRTLSNAEAGAKILEGIGDNADPNSFYYATNLSARERNAYYSRTNRRRQALGTDLENEKTLVPDDIHQYSPTELIDAFPYWVLRNMIMVNMDRPLDQLADLTYESLSRPSRDAASMNWKRANYLLYVDLEKANPLSHLRWVTSLIGLWWNEMLRELKGPPANKIRRSKARRRGDGPDETSRAG